MSPGRRLRRLAILAVLVLAVALWRKRMIAINERPQSDGRMNGK